MKDKKFKCPRCGKSAYVKNGCSGRGKNKKQKFKCKFCGKSFVERNPTLTRTEKRLLSLFINFIDRNMFKDTSLKDFLRKCDGEIPSVAKSKFKVEYEEVDLAKLQNVAVVVCKNENGIEIIKFGTNAEQPWQEKVEGRTIPLAELAKLMFDCKNLFE